MRGREDNIVHRLSTRDSCRRTGILQAFRKKLRRFTEVLPVAAHQHLAFQRVLADAPDFLEVLAQHLEFLHAGDDLTAG